MEITNTATKDVAKMMLNEKTTMWVITDGKAGAQSQSIGLANALRTDYVIKKIILREPWIQFSPWLLRLGLKYAFTKKSAPLSAPWPDIIISSGSRSSVAALYVKSQNPSTNIIQIQSPGIRSSFFDVLICPEHDKISHLIDKKNVIRIKWVLHDVTRNCIDLAKEKYTHLKNTNQKCVALLIGGKSRVSKLTPKITLKLCEQIDLLQKKENLHLLVTASRRTEKKSLAILNNFFSGRNNIFFTPPSNKTDKHLYHAFLGLADTIIVTSDSISMISEACSTGKPVYLYNLPRKKSKFDSFYEHVINSGACRIFDGKTEDWQYTIPSEMSTVIEKIKTLLAC